jgi:hypothetical protein
LDEFAWFDLRDEDDLRPIDRREGQNMYIGASAERLSAGIVDYARGSTLLDAILMLVPRALWPAKPVRSGGSSLVSAYTGIGFWGSTSVGAGQVMELYINFGTPGVVLGFGLFGALMAFLDRAAARRLGRGEWTRFVPLYSLGLGLMQPGNAFSSLAVSGISGLLAALLVNQVLSYRDQRAGASAETRVPDAAEAQDRSVARAGTGGAQEGGLVL